MMVLQISLYNYVEMSFLCTELVYSMYYWSRHQFFTELSDLWCYKTQTFDRHLIASILWLCNPLLVSFLANKCFASQFGSNQIAYITDRYQIWTRLNNVIETVYNINDYIFCMSVFSGPNWIENVLRMQNDGLWLRKCCNCTCNE
jgi:hypothetical protein